MRWGTLFICLLTNCNVLAQTATVTGHITDVETGETLVAATIQEGRLLRGTTCNQYGFYSLSLPRGSLTVTYSYVGYQPQVLQLFLTKDTVLNVKLQSRTLLDSVVIYAGTRDSHTYSNISSVTVPVKMITDLPALMGEPDVLKSLQLLPGVKMGYEGSSGIYVRGGGPDQNLIILDGVPVYNASHVYGFFSTFNPDAINHVELITGGFPARYGGRLSSIVDITMREGNHHKLRGQGTLGVITSRFVLEGPIVKEKGSFIVSARRSYLNLLRAPIVNHLTDGSDRDFYFYDLNAKFNYRLSATDRLFFSAYKGKDNSSLTDEQTYQDSTRQLKSSANSQQSWGNLVMAARWNHTYSTKLFSNVALTFTKYQFEADNENSHVIRSSGQLTSSEFTKYVFQSGVRDVAARADFDFVAGPSNHFRFGGNYTNHLFTPGVIAIHSSENSSGMVVSPSETYANEMSAYAEDEATVGHRWRFNAGLHAAFFLTQGAFYPSLQPRLSANYKISEKWVLRAAYASMRQYVHLLSNSGIGLPTDLWTPTTGRVQPEASYQETIGITRFFGTRYKLNLEGYYKTMTGLIEYAEGANYLKPSQSWEDKVEKGRGESYGGEVLIEKTYGGLTGWIGLYAFMDIAAV